MWGDMKKDVDAAAARASSPSSEEASARVAAAESSADALAREMEEAEDVFGDDTAPAPAPPKVPEESATETLARTRLKTSSKETTLRQSLADKTARVRAEAQRLALFESELQKLKVREAADVGDLRSKLEEMQRDIAWLERDFNNKETSYLAAKTALEGARSRKSGMHEQLALLVLSSEKRKEEKLDELERRIASAEAGDGGAPTDEALLG